MLAIHVSFKRYQTENMEVVCKRSIHEVQVVHACRQCTTFHLRAQKLKNCAGNILPTHICWPQTINGFWKSSLNCQCIETNFLLLFAFLIFNVQFVPRHRSPMIEYGRSLAQVRIAEVTCHIMSLKFSNRSTQSMDSLLELFSHIPKWQLCLWTGKTPLRPFFSNERHSFFSLYDKTPCPHSLHPT